MGFIHNDHKNLSCKEIFEELVKKRFDEIIQLNNAAIFDDLIYYFRGDTARKRFDDFKDAINLFEKIKSDEMNIENAKNLQN